VFFDTPIYLIFLTLVVLLYWRLPWRPQNVFLLCASYFFYGWWDWRFLALIAISTLVDFFCARYIASSGDPRMRRLLLSLSVVLNLSFLGFFKYSNFFAGSLAAILDRLGFHVDMFVLRVLLPPGISFYTFQELAYIVDVYSGKLRPAKSLVDYALFISLFPHLIAGPIQRPAHLLPQVSNPRRLDTSRFFDGLMLIISGLFRKGVIADNCALLANAAFDGKLGEPSLAVLAIGAYAFAWQIYGDFSGYSDIARGSAQLLGFHFMVNFRQPYLAQSLQDFWRRWHISLSTWLRDYLYIPLGGNRKGERRTYANLAATMLIGGLWHGANWTFIAWGGIHGAGLAMERFYRKVRGLEQHDPPPLPGGAPLVSPSAWVRKIVVFHLVCLAWILFRAPSITAAGRLLKGLGRWTWRPEYLSAFTFLAVFSVPLFVLDLLLEWRSEEYVFQMTGAPLRIGWAMALVALVVLFSANQLNAFIYFQF
jgi:D-alanyl-lipoteichoic acid acyltransferase DltB (MBOAT superfamily)